MFLMVFLNPNILFALSAVVIPILIHLFNLRRIKKMEFSTLMFIKEIQKSKLRRIKIKQWILLFIRVLTIICLVLAFSNPIMMENKLFSNGNLKKLGIIVLDDSYSMNIRNENGNSFEIAKNSINDIIKDYNQNDNIIFLISSSLKQTDRRINDYSLSQIKDSVLNSGIKYKVFYYDELRDLLNNPVLSNENILKEIFVFSDFRKSNFRNINGENFVTDKNCFLYMVNTSNREGNNISLSDIELKTKITEPGRNIKLYITLNNFSQLNLYNKKIRLYCENSLISENTVDLNPGEKKQVEFSFKPFKTGSNKCYFELIQDKFSDDELIEDNKYYFVLDIPEKINVGILSDDNSGINRYLIAALETANKFVKDSSEHSNIVFNYKLSAAFYNTDVIIINNKISLNETEKNNISTYLRDGKGIICFATRNMDVQNYNSLLTTLGCFQIIKPEYANKELPGNSEKLNYKQIDISHPLFDGVFKKEDVNDFNNNKSIESPDINEYFSVLPNNNSIPIITLSDGSNFLTESNLQPGKFIFCSVSSSPDMSKFSSTSLFPTVVIRGVQYLAGNNNENLQYEIGNQNIIPIKKSTGNINSVTTPDSKKFNSTFYSSLNNTSVSAGRKEYFSFPYAVYSQLPGFYEFSDSAGSIIKIIALNPEPSESNIAKYDSKDIEDYFNKLGFKNLKFISKPESLHSELIRSRQGTDLTKYFLILVLFLIISEVLYTRKLEKG